MADRRAYYVVYAAMPDGRVEAAADLGLETDDHLRNFSFRTGEEGFRLSPAYDLVPADVLGAYPTLTMGYKPGRPRPASPDAEEAARAFQLRPKEARRIMEQLQAAFTELPEVMEQAGLNDADRGLIDRVFWSPDRR